MGITEITQGTLLQIQSMALLSQIGGLTGLQGMFEIRFRNLCNCLSFTVDTLAHIVSYCCLFVVILLV
jgi:hypothetical protein